MKDISESYISPDEIVHIGGELTEHINTENWSTPKEKGYFPDIDAIYTDEAQQTSINAEYMEKVNELISELPQPCKLQFTVEDDKPLVIEVIDPVNEGEDEQKHLGFIIIAPIVDR